MSLYGDLPILDAGLIARLATLAQHRGIAAPAMPSGAGHDAAVFAQQGVRTAMIFVRNRHGSHNPQEAMDMPDFAVRSGEHTSELQSLMRNSYAVFCLKKKKKKHQ